MLQHYVVLCTTYLGSVGGDRKYKRSNQTDKHIYPNDLHSEIYKIPYIYLILTIFSNV